MGRRQAEHQSDMIRAMHAFEWDMHSTITRAGRLPSEWREIWETRSAKKERVTLRVDADVVRFFKSMGDGYGPRMNAVLRSFMQARLAGLIEGEDLAASYREDWMGAPRPSPATAAQQAAERASDMAELNALLDKLSECRKAGRLPPPTDMTRLDYLSHKTADRGVAGRRVAEDGDD